MKPTSPNTDREQIPLFSFVPFLLITFGLAGGIVGLYIFCSDQMVRLFGALSGEHPLFFLAVYAPAIAAFFVVTSEFHPWEKQMMLQEIFVMPDVPILSYLEKLDARGEDPLDYESIWYYY